MFLLLKIWQLSELLFILLFNYNSTSSLADYHNSSSVYFSFFFVENFVFCQTGWYHAIEKCLAFGNFDLDFK